VFARLTSALESLHTPAYRRFRERLRAARVEAELSQAAVARALRVPQSYVSRCETGERRVDVVELARFAKLYRKTLEWFVQP
jgi:transcriptional regulator with XRE-family HTH domain